MTIRRVLLLFLLVVGGPLAALSAQDTAAADHPPVLTELQAKDVLIVQLNERIVALQNELTRLELILDKQQRTPPIKDGYAWDWTPNAQGQPTGYVKVPSQKPTP